MRRSGQSSRTHVTWGSADETGPIQCPRPSPGSLHGPAFKRPLNPSIVVFRPRAALHRREGLDAPEPCPIPFGSFAECAMVVLRETARLGLVRTLYDNETAVCATLSCDFAASGAN